MHVQEVAQEVAALQEHASHRKKWKCHIFCGLNRHKNIETQEVKNVHCKKLENLWCSLPFYYNIICSVEFI